jgi:hypothetical protein
MPRTSWRLVAAAAAGSLAVLALPSIGAEVVSTPPPLVPAGYLALRGPLHEHSGYSDGWPGSTPGTYYDSAARFGNDFLFSGEHSDTLDVPVAASEYCLGPEVPTCIGGDPDPAKSLRKWDAMATYADQATTATFTGVRGFEWTSDRFDHLNVYFSKNVQNAKTQGGYADMSAFYNWLTTRSELGGGGDGVGTFNHPGAKNLPGVGDSDPQQTWNDFAYVPAADNQMVGVEVYNDDQEYGSRGPAEGYYVHALDKGWHVGAVGAEDLGHAKTDDWGGPGWAKTVILSRDRSAAALRAAMLARRFYAVRRPGTQLAFTVNDALMGSRLQAHPGAPLTVAAQAVGANPLDLEVVTSGGAVVARGNGSISTEITATPGQRYYFLRVRDGSDVVGYSSPVWVSPGRAPRVGEWLAGDLHVHTCYSHDAYCPRGDNGRPTGDYNTGEEELYTFGGTPQERFAEAAARGLDYLALTDHHSDGHPEESGYRSVEDPGFGTSGVIGIRGYENSVTGHAQMLGATRIYPSGTGDAGIEAMADALRADGGVFQANHPADGLTGPLTSCDDLTGLHWGYGLRVPVDTVEVWNIGHVLQPPLPAGTSNADALAYWECWLNTGARVAPTGGSDSHWMSTAAFQGVGNPTTWVFTDERSERGVLEAIKAGRTSISFQPPVSGATVLLLEGDVDRDGTYEAMVGDTVPGGTPMRVRATGAPAAGLVEVRVNGRTLIAGDPLAPGGSVAFTVPDESGWVRAELHAEDFREERRENCAPHLDDAADAVAPVVGTVADGLGEDAPSLYTTYCRNRVGVLALTAAMYLGAASAPDPNCTPKSRPARNPNDDKCKDKEHALAAPRRRS